MKKSRLWSLIIQVILTLILMVGQLPLSSWADTGSTPTPVPKLVTPAKAQNKQATFQQGVIQSPQAQDNRYQITTNLAAFQQTPNLQAVTIQIQPQAQKIVAHTKWILQVPVLAVDLTQLSKELPAGLQLTKDDEHGIVTVKADHDLKLKRQQNVQLNFPVRAVAGEFPFYLAMVYGQTQTTLPTTSLGTLKLSGLLAHYQPQTQTRSLEKVLGHPVATPAKTRSTSPEHAKPSSPATHSLNSATPAPARQVKSEYHAPTKSQTRKPQSFSQTPTTVEPTTNTAKVIQQLAHKPQLKSTATASTNTTPPANAFNSSIAQRSDTPPAAINNSDQGIKIHAENTQTHELVQKLNDDSISTQDVTPEFAAYFDGEGMDNPDTTPTATVRVDAHGNGTLNVKQSGWYILHQTNNYKINSGWTYLVLNIDGSYTHSTTANYYAAYYDADKNQVTQAMSGGSQFLLPVYASDVTEYLKYMGERHSDPNVFSWSQAWNYIQKNGGTVTFYGTGDLTNKLGTYNASQYRYFGEAEVYEDSRNTEIRWDRTPVAQRYKYGLWLKNSIDYSTGLKHPLLKTIDVTKTPLALSTTKPALQKITATSCSSADTSVQWTSDLVTLGSRKMQRVNISTQDRTTQKALKDSQYNVFFAGVDGNGNDGTLGVTLQNQSNMVNQLTGTLYLSNFNRDGWYILQQKDVPNNETDNETDYQVNGSYYAVKFSVLEGITDYFRVSQQYGDQLPLPPFVSDVTEYLKYMGERHSDPNVFSWSQAWNYIQKNGGTVTFYGTGDLTNKLGTYNASQYRYFGEAEVYEDSRNTEIRWDRTPVAQRYKYGLWLKNSIDYSLGIKHPLPKTMDITQFAVPLSTIGSPGAQLTTLTAQQTTGNTQDGVLTYTNDYSTSNEQQITFRNQPVTMTKIDANTHQKLAGATFKVWYSGNQGAAAPKTLDQIPLPAIQNQPLLETVATNSVGQSLFNYNLEGWYILQESHAPAGYGLNGNYYAIYLSGAGITKLMQYSSNDASQGPVAALPANYTAGSQATDSLVDGSYIDGNPTAIDKWQNGIQTHDGFLQVKAGQLTVADRFNGINKIDADLPQKTLAGATFNIWDSGADGSGVLDSQKDLQFLGATAATNKNGQTLFSLVKRRGWYIIQEKTPPAGYNQNNQYYAMYYDPANGVIGLMKHANRQLLPVYASDVTEYLKYMGERHSDPNVFSWSQAWNYIQKNGGTVTFYGTGDLTNKLGTYNASQYRYFGEAEVYEDSRNTEIRWDRTPVAQRYKYGLWLKNSIDYSTGVKHPLPQAIKVDETPLVLSTKNQEYLDLAPDQPAYNQGLTTADGFLTGQNGALNFRDKFIGIQKVDQDDNHQTLSGATFKVFDSGIDGKQTPQSNPKVSKSTDSHGITQMPVAGGDWYIIQEQDPPEGYSQNPNYYALKIDATDGIVAMMKDYSPTLQPVFKASGQSNYGTELSLAPDTTAYEQPALTTDGFLIAQAGHLIFQDKFTGLAKLDYYDSTVPVSDAQFHLWYTGIDGNQAPVVVDNHSRIPTDSGYDETQTTFTTQGKGLLKLNMTATGWYVLAEGEPAPGYRDHQGFYYAFHWSGGSGVDQFCQGHELHLVQPFVSDVTEYLKYMGERHSDPNVFSWSQAWNYIQKNGGTVTFYGTGDLTNKLGTYNASQYRYFGEAEVYEDSRNTEIRWDRTPVAQRYKYGLWLKNSIDYSTGLKHPLPQNIDVTQTPLALSTKSHSIVQLPYADKQNYNAPYRKGVTSFDGFLTAKNGALYMRNVPVTYLTLDEDNPLVIRRSDLGKVSWRGTWHDLYCQPNNQQTAKVSLQIDDQKAADITQPTTARIVGTDEFGQNDFSVQFLNDTSAPTAIDATHGSAGLITANHDTALGEHTLTFQAHGSVDSAVIKKKLIVVPDNYPYGAQITKDFTVNQKNKHQTQAVLSDLQHGTGDLVTVYTHLKNTGDPLHAGKITTQIPSQFNYLGPTQGTIELTTQTQEKVAAAVTFDGTNLTVTLPDPLPQNSEYTLQYDLQQIAPMPLSYPGPSGGAQAQDHFSADSGNTDYPYYGTNSNTVHWYSNQALWVQLLRVPPLDFGTKLLIKDYKNAFFNNTATTEDATQNVLQLKDRGYNQQNTWQLTANLSAFSNLQDPTATLPDAYIHYGNDQTFNQPANTTFNKDIYPNQPPVVLLERTSGKLPGGADIIQQLKQVRLQLGSQDPKPGSYRATMTYTLTQSLQ